METGTLREIDALRLLRAKRAAHEALSEILQVLVECDLVGDVEVTEEPLVLMVPACGDASPRKL